MTKNLTRSYIKIHVTIISLVDSDWFTTNNEMLFKKKMLFIILTIKYFVPKIR